MNNLDEKLINYGGLAHFQDRLLDDGVKSVKSTWSSEKIDTELKAAIAAIPQPEAGDNISIESNTISAKGYKFDDEPKKELKLIDDILLAAGMPSSVSLGLKVSGAAGTTTYTWTDAMGGMFARAVQMGLLPSVGATYQTANGKSGVIAAVDGATITFEETLDAVNALTNEPVDYVVATTQLFSFTEGICDYIEGDISSYKITLSGDAGATTYTYSKTSLMKQIFSEGAIFKLQDGRSAKAISFDKANSTITFDSTFDADNALSKVLITSVAKKNNASGKYSHAEGGRIIINIAMTNTASGEGSHAEGAGATASGLGSHAECSGTASGVQSHAEGVATASGEGSHAECSGTASGTHSHAEGAATASGLGSHAEGYYKVMAQNTAEHAEGTSNVSHKASADYGNAGNTQHSVGIGAEGGRGGKNAFEIMQNGDMYVLGVGGYQGTNTKVQDATIKTLQEYITSLESRIHALEHPQTTA